MPADMLDRSTIELHGSDEFESSKPVKMTEPLVPEPLLPELDVIPSSLSKDKEILSSLLNTSADDDLFSSRSSAPSTKSASSAVHSVFDDDDELDDSFTSFNRPRARAQARDPLSDLLRGI